MSEEVKLGLKETKEMLNGLKILAVGAAKIWKDGKINTSDLSELIELAKKFDTLSEAFKGLDLVDDEIRDIDEVEAMEVVAEVFSIFKAVKEARV